jgi:O-succinylbenzoic acid--CoA ligase
MSGILSINGIDHPTHQLDDALASASSPFVQQAIQFCRDWHAGREQFSFPTSGSTGVPKRISFTRDQLIASARLSAQALQLKSGETALVCLDTQLIAGAMMLVRSLVTGMNIVLEEPSAHPLKSILMPIHFAALVPYQVETMLRENASALENIKTIIIGGAPLQSSTVRSLKPFKNQIYATYGMTETITHIALQRLSGTSAQDHFHALDTIALSTDERGCLLIRAPHLGAAPIVTNDRVNLIDDRSFSWLGRVDRVINSGGIKVQAEHIEEVVELILHESGIVRRFFVAGIPDQQWGERITLFVEGNLAPDQQANIERALKARLARYEIPKDIVCLERFTETASQKIDRLATLQNTTK